jgi:hypothetical protein
MVGFLVPLLLIGSGAGATAWFMSDSNKLSKEDHNKLTRSALYAKYSEFLQDERYKNDRFVLDLERGLLFNLDTNACWKEYQKDGGVYAAYVRTNDNGEPVRSYSSNMVDYFHQLMDRRLGVFGLRSSVLPDDRDVFVTYYKNGVGWYTETHDGSYTTAFFKDQINILKEQVSELSHATKNKLLSYASELDRLPQSERSMFNFVDESMKQKVDKIIDVIIKSAPIKSNNFEDISPQLAKLPYDKKLYAIQKLYESDGDKGFDLYTRLELDKDKSIADFITKIGIQATPSPVQTRKEAIAQNKAGAAADAANVTTDESNIENLLSKLPFGIGGFVKKYPYLSAGLACILGGPIAGMLLKFAIPGISTYIGASALSNLMPLIGAGLICYAGYSTLTGKSSDTKDSMTSLSLPELSPTGFSSPAPVLEKPSELPIKEPTTTPTVAPLASTTKRVTDISDGALLSLPKLGEEKPSFASALKFQPQVEAVHN